MLKDIQKDFPVLSHEKLIYLDTAASSLTPQVVIDAMNEYYMHYPVNVHRGVYEMSYKATNRYHEAREKIAAFINASFDEIIFTRGASSALNLVASSYGLDNLKPGDEIIVSELEHHSSFLPWLNVAKKTGAVIKFVKLNEEGRITIDAFKDVLSEKTKVVALTYISNVMGYITPLKQIIDLAHEKDAIVIVDAAQAAPHKVIDVKALDCDFLAFSGHKMCGPTGIGILYGKRKLLKQMSPVEFGGDMNDNVDKDTADWKDAPYRFETGTPPIAEAIGLATAVDYLKGIGLANIYAHEKALKDYTVKKLNDIEGVTVYNQTAETGIINFNIDDVHPHDAVTAFDQDHIALRAGHHCAQLVIKWLKVPATLRASFYIYNTIEDCDAFVESVKQARIFFTEVGF